MTGDGADHPRSAGPPDTCAEGGPRSSLQVLQGPVLPPVPGQQAVSPAPRQRGGDGPHCPCCSG